MATSTVYPGADLVLICTNDGVQLLGKTSESWGAISGSILHGARDFGVTSAGAAARSDSNKRNSFAVLGTRAYAACMYPIWRSTIMSRDDVRPVASSAVGGGKGSRE